MYTYTQTYVCKHVYTYVYMCMCMYMYTYMYVLMDASVHVRINTLHTERERRNGLYKGQGVINALFFSRLSILPACDCMCPPKELFVSLSNCLQLAQAVAHSCQGLLVVCETTVADEGCHS